MSPDQDVFPCGKDRCFLSVDLLRMELGTHECLTRFKGLAGSAARGEVGGSQPKVKSSSNASQLLVL